MPKVRYIINAAVCHIVRRLQLPIANVTVVLLFTSLKRTYDFIAPDISLILILFYFIFELFYSHLIIDLWNRPGGSEIPLQERRGRSQHSDHCPDSLRNLPRGLLLPARASGTLPYLVSCPAYQRRGQVSHFGGSSRGDHSVPSISLGDERGFRGTAGTEYVICQLSTLTSHL
jgi:hypothetical protein